MTSMLSFPKLLMSAVNGRGCIGIAVTLLLHCDLVYSVEGAKFWIPFTRLALVPEFASGWILPGICGKARANRLLLLGEEITAREACESFGIVTKVVPKGKDVVEEIVSDVENLLLKLTHGAETGAVFVDLIRRRTNRKEDMELIILEELRVLRDRVNKGEVLDAAKVMMANKKSSKKNKRRSNL